LNVAWRGLVGRLRGFWNGGGLCRGGGDDKIRNRVDVRGWIEKFGEQGDSIFGGVTRNSASGMKWIYNADFGVKGRVGGVIEGWMAFTSTVCYEMWSTQGGPGNELP
jgi:hypothetical protein